MQTNKQESPKSESNLREKSQKSMMQSEEGEGDRVGTPSLTVSAMSSFRSQIEIEKE